MLGVATMASFFLIVVSCQKPEDEINSSKGTIYGTVTDFATGEPVANANISLRPSGETTLSGLDGQFEFNDLEEGGYSITVSKAEYSELIDPYVIQVKKGKRMRRDLQIEKLPTTIKLVDVNGSPINQLDYGSDASVIAKTFYIFNNGTVKVNCKLVHNCNWISSVSNIPNDISPGQTIPVAVNINRSLLAVGQNTTKMTVRTTNGSAELTISAVSAGGNPPAVQISSASSITATAAFCQGSILDANGGTISDCGFCYSTSSNPSISNDKIQLGPSTGSFSTTLSFLEQNTTYHVRAYAISNLGIGYSSEITFTTLSGMPTCGATTITNVDPTTARGQSSASGNNGYSITEKGICWSTNHTPTINDQTATSGFGDGTISTYLSSLQPNTTYRVRSYATNEFGTAYGPETTFTSLSGLPTVTTSSATLSGDEVITGGYVTDDAGTVIYTYGVCYGSGQNPTISGQHTEDGYEAGSFTSYIPRPSNSGYLYIRAYATTKYGTQYGNQVSIYIP